MDLRIITALIRQGHEGTHDLYSKIPYFFRTRLDAAISEIEWASISEGCEHNDPSSQMEAKQVYHELLQQADKCINEFNKNPQTENGLLLRVDKYNLEEEFKDDAPRFVAEMARCLKREKELIFTYNETVPSESAGARYADDDMNQMETDDLETIEQLFEEVNCEVSKAKQSIEELSMALAGNEILAPEIGYLPGITNFELLLQQFVACKESVLAGLENLRSRCSAYAEKLAEELNSWKVAVAKASVKVGPDPDTDSLINKYARFGKVVSSIFAWFAPDSNLQIIRDFENNPTTREFCVEVGRIQIDFERIQNSCIQIIVVLQPRGVIGIENKGKKDSPNYCTKKTQPFTTEVRILAGECFSNFQISDAKVQLLAEKDNTPVTGKNGDSCLKAECTFTETKVCFKIEVKNFSRIEQNNVYKQFFRLLYDIKVSVNGNDYSLRTLSLPITFNTGANQILEHKGAGFWYCASVEDLYKSPFQCPDPLPADTVIKMLDDRVSCLGKNGRRLTEDEKIFLKTRLPTGNDGTVTMQGFLKDKMKTLRMDCTLSFSFYTWFYAVINSIEELLLSAWQDGIIYGICSDKMAEEILMQPKIPEGTFLLRPSISEIQKTSSADATAALTMEIKLKNEDAQPFEGHKKEYQIKPVPLLYNYIAKTNLYDAISSIAFNDKPVAKFLYRRDGGSNLGILERYGKKNRTEKSFPEYQIIMQKTARLNISRMPKADDAATDERSDGDNDSGREPHRRKRRYRKSSSNTQGQSDVQSPPLLPEMESSNSAQSLPNFSELSEKIKQENSPQFQFQSSGTANEHCQRSGSQGRKMPGTSDEQTFKGSKGQLKHGLESSWIRETPSGTVFVDVSHISNISARNGHASPVSLPHISGNAEMASSQYQGSAGFLPLPSQLNAQASTLPTVLDESTNSSRGSRRQGSARGNSGSNRKKPPPFSKPEAKQVLVLNTRPNFELVQNGLNGQSSTSIVGVNIFNDNNSLNFFNGIGVVEINEEDFTALIEDQTGQQLSPDSGSPDSGVGEQSFSPPYTWQN